MKTVLIVLAWIATGLLSAITIIFKTGIIPFIVPGLIIGLCGAAFHALLVGYIPKSPWWLSAILITLLSITVTLLLIPDTRHWVIMRMMLAYYSILSFVFCLVKYLTERYARYRVESKQR